MKFIKTKRKDLEPIMKIIGEAQVFLASHNIDQWQNGYPNEEAMRLCGPSQDSDRGSDRNYQYSLLKATYCRTWGSGPGYSL